MARRAKTTKVKAPVEETPVEGVVEAPTAVEPAQELAPAPVEAVEEIPKLSSEELRSILAAEMQAQIEKLKAENARLSKMYLLAKLDPKGLITVQEDKAAAAEKATRAQMEKYRAVVAGACKRFGLNASKTAYDPDTGILRELE